MQPNWNMNDSKAIKSWIAQNTEMQNKLQNVIPFCTKYHIDIKLISLNKRVMNMIAKKGRGEKKRCNINLASKRIEACQIVWIPNNVPL